MIYSRQRSRMIRPGMHAEFSGPNSGDGVPICLLMACDLVISALVRRLKSPVAMLLDKRKAGLCKIKPAFQILAPHRGRISNYMLSIFV